MTTESYWQATAPSSARFPALTRDLEVDVVVIGGGLTGITAAYFLKKAGVKVALLERNRFGCCDTGHTTAHLTYVTDERLHHLVKTFGEDAAQSFWEAGVAAIDMIYQNVRELEIECEFKWIPGFLHAGLDNQNNDDRESLQKDLEAAQRLGFEAAFEEEVPYAKKPGVRFAHQAKFHPLKYLAPLLQGIPGNGSYLFEETEAREIEDKPLRVHAGQFKIKCEYLVIATHTPLTGKSSLASATLFQSKLALYTSYVVGATLRAGEVPEALYWDTSDPYRYLRVDRHADHDYLIFGGEDCKTGQEKDTKQVFSRLENLFKNYFPTASLKHRWLGQVVETNDGLPFIGESSENQFIATGFCGNGFTLGTLSAAMARDRYLKKNNPWFDLFAVNRKKFHGGTWRYIKENLDYPYYMLRDRLQPAEGKSVDELKMGEGKILSLNGKKTAAFRDLDGKVHLCSPVCTHLKCIVHWNDSDNTWDCPCHGSRFKPTGEVFAGPAETPLEKLPGPKRSLHRTSAR
jgi:glycine/D-amino acid oxidase-like deaminating enzyme/nitrite reductase/ring-hydroxylating ferredoxin subunit